jgi:hypothetical protein
MVDKDSTMELIIKYVGGAKKLRAKSLQKRVRSRKRDEQAMRWYLLRKGRSKGVPLTACRGESPPTVRDGAAREEGTDRPQTVIAKVLKPKFSRHFSGV